MLSPSDIREKRKSLEKGTFGYKVEEVNAFLDMVADDYEVLYNNNEESEEKIIKLVEKINEYREDEDAIKLALLSAQKESKRILADSKAESERMITEAKAESDKMLADAKAESEEVARQSEIECEKIINEHKERCAKLIRENTEATEKKIASVKAEYELQSKRLADVKREVAQFKAALTQIFNKQLSLVEELPDETEDVAVVEDVLAPTDDDVPFLEEMLEEAKEEETVEAVAEETVETVAVAEETPLIEEEPVKDIAALKDQSLFQEKREVKFSDLRFGNRN